MDIKNYSAEPINKIYSWLPYDLEAEKIIFFPDVCPVRDSLPTGSVVYTKQKKWRRFAVSDVGCGMLLAKSSVKISNFDKSDWNNIYSDLKANKGKLGDLGSGNHFLDALEAYTDDYIYFLIHTGSRDESKTIDKLVDKPVKFDRTYTKVCNWAKNNRMKIAEIIEQYFGELEILVDRSHNNYEKMEIGTVIRKGAVKIKEGELTVLPSNLDGDVVLVRATSKVENTFNSLNHGTGRVMSRSEAKIQAAQYDYNELRDRIYIPEMISNASIKTEAPFCYRKLDDCLNLIDDLITVEKRFSPFAYLGQI